MASTVLGSTFKSESSKGYIIALIVVLFATCFQFTYSRYVIFTEPLKVDAIEYLRYGWNLSHHHIYSKAPPSTKPLVADYDRPFVYPAILATIFTLSGSEDQYFKNIILIQNILRILTTYLVFAIARRFLPEMYAAGVALLTLLDPGMLLLSQHILTETVAEFLFTCSVFYFLKFRKNTSFINCTLLFFILSLILFLHPTYLFIPWILLVFLYDKRKLKPYLFLVTFVSLAFGITLYLTNQGQNKSGAETVFARSLADGMFPNFKTDYSAVRAPFTTQASPPSFRDDMVYENMIRDPHYALRELLARIPTDPALYAAWYLLGKPAVLWNQNLTLGENPPNVHTPKLSMYSASIFNRVFNIVLSTIYYLMLGIVICSLPILIFLKFRGFSKDEKNIYLLWISFCAYITAIHMIFVSAPRYAAPLHVGIYFLGMLILFWIRQNFLAHKQLALREDPL